MTKQPSEAAMAAASHEVLDWLFNSINGPFVELQTPVFDAMRELADKQDAHLAQQVATIIDRHLEQERQEVREVLRNVIVKQLEDRLYMGFRSARGVYSVVVPTEFRPLVEAFKARAESLLTRLGGK